METRTGTASEIKNFPLFNEDNEGDEITVVVEDNEIVAYAQHTDGTIYFMESVQRGAGRFLVEWFQSEFAHLVAVNVEPTAIGFYEKMGFEFAGRDEFGGLTYEQWKE